MTPMAKARGLQLARNDKAAASGCMTAARQSRNPAACASSEAWARNRGLGARLLTLDILPRRRFPPGTRRMFSSQGAVLLNRLLRRSGVPEHIGSVPQQKGDGASPMPEGRGLRAGER